MGFVGRSGPGKTTFVKLVQCPHEVTGGATMLNGDDIACVSLAELRSHVVLVPKEPLLFHRSLAENVCLARLDASMDEFTQRR